MNNLLIGCVADDFTGASDAASFLLVAGLKTLLISGTPKKTILGDYEAIVIALKSRTQEKESAVQDSLEAFDWLVENNAKHLYFKYCSTFDSTKEGNIGPVLDAVLEKYSQPYSIICPALPVNKRIVKNGHLFVEGNPLHESHMKNHPLTPMWASSIDDLMKEQGEYTVLNIDFKLLEKPVSKIQIIIDSYAKQHKHFYIATDYIEEVHAEKIAEVFENNYILSGGSGVLTALGKKYKNKSGSSEVYAMPATGTNGKGIIFAGSCSKMTKSQVSYFKALHNPTFEIDPQKLLNKEITEEEIFSFILKHADKAVLLYSSGSGGASLSSDNDTHQKYATTLESTLANLAVKAVENGFKRIICAGGETSSAITKQLGFSSFIIGESIAPGVPVMIPTEMQDIRLVLKSGNFGQEDFFVKALSLTKK